MTVIDELAICHAGFSATKQIGYILRTASGRALNWSQACQVLDLLHNNAGFQIAEAHLNLVGKSDFKQVAQHARTGDWHRGSHPSERGHIFKSEAIHAQFGGFVVSILIAYTVCVTLPSPYEAHREKPAQSKFWYSAVIEPRVAEFNDISSPEVQAALTKCCGAIEELARKALEVTLPLYRQTIAEMDADIGEVTINEDYFISDLCVELNDPMFRGEAARLADGQVTIAASSAHSMELLANLARTGQLLDNWHGDDAISERSFTQVDPHSARAVYIETTQPKDHGFFQKAIGVTHCGEPVRPTSVNASDYEEALLRHRASHSISNARVTAAVSRL